MIVAIFVIAIAQFIWGFNWNWREVAETNFQLLKNQYLGEALITFIGLELGAMSHSISDIVVSHFKQSQKKPKKRRYKRKKK